MSDPLQPHGLEPARLHCPWDSPGKNTGVSCHAVFQRIFLTGIKPMSPRSPALAGELFTTTATWEAPVATEDATGSKISQEASGEVTLN